MTLKMLDEKFAQDQISIQHDFSSSNIIFPFFAIFAFCWTDPIFHGIFVMLDEMLDGFNKVFILSYLKI